MKINGCLDCAHCDMCGLKDETNEFFSDFYDWLRVTKRQSYDIPEFPPNCSIEPKCTKFQSFNHDGKEINI